MIIDMIEEHASYLAKAYRLFKKNEMIRLYYLWRLNRKEKRSIIHFEFCLRNLIKCCCIHYKKDIFHNIRPLLIGKVFTLNEWGYLYYEKKES